MNKLISFENTEVAFAHKSTDALKKMNFLFTLMGVSELTKVGTFFIKTLLYLHFPIKKIIKSTLFRQFCGGETLEECQNVVNQLNKIKIASILDFAAEGAATENSYHANFLSLMETIKKSAEMTSVRFCVFKVSAIGSVALLEKYQNNKSVLPEVEINQLQKIKDRIYHLCFHAYQLNIKLLIDAEESWIQQSIDDLTIPMMEKFNKEKPMIYITMQMYRSDGLNRLKALKTNAHNYIPAIKLVRGAYMEKENQRAKKFNYPSPIHSSKQGTDRAFDDALAFCIDNNIALCAGSHNEKSMLLLTTLMHEKGIPQLDSQIEFAQLYGMGDTISVNLSHHGYSVSKYVPFGPVNMVMPYLFRRAQENSAVIGQIGRELQLIRGELKRRKQLP